MKGKLKPFEEVKNRIARQVIENLQSYSVYHSRSYNHLTVFKSKVHRFGTIVDIELIKGRPHRKIYKDHFGAHYYGEWFEWIGEEPFIIKPLEEGLWDISDW
jgi:hypothetical protein